MGLVSRIKRIFQSGRHSADIQDELQFHLAMELSEGTEDRQARLRFGNVSRIAEETRAAGLVEWLDSWWQDVRYACFQLRKSPGLALAVVLSLMVGIGANTAIFSLVDAAILRPLPVKDPDSLRVIEWTSNAFPKWLHNINGSFYPHANNGVQASSVGADLYRRIEREQSAFESLIGVADAYGASISMGSSGPEQVSVQHVSANFFQALGVTPAVGRGFRIEEDRVGQEPVVVVSHRFWTTRLANETSALGRVVLINNVPARIVGVAPAGFFGVTPGQWTDIYAPLSARVAFQASTGEDDQDWWVRQIGRLRPGTTETAAQAQLNLLFRNLAVPAATTVERDKIPNLFYLPGRRGIGALNPKDSGPLWILMLLVSLLLLLVCVNVANLLLSRSTARLRESAVRLALGASRVRLFRQAFVESVVLALLGGAVAIAFGYAMAQSIHLLFETGRTPSNAFDLSLDLRVLGYTSAVSLLAALLFGLVPAFRSSRAHLNDALKTHTRSVSGGRLRLPRMLVSVQVALCLAALLAAGLLGRSFGKLKWMDVGFDRGNLAYATVNPSQAGYTPQRIAAYVSRVRQELSSLPGIQRAGLLEVRLLSGNGNLLRIQIPGHPAEESAGLVASRSAANMNHVADGTFETLGIPLVMGRLIEPRDLTASSDAVIVDELFARHFFPGRNPLGMRFGTNLKEPAKFQIVGVVRNARYNSLRGDPTPTLYLPYETNNVKGAVHFAIRASIDSGPLEKEVRQAIASVDPAVPLTEFHTQTGLIDRLLRIERLLAFLSASFGAVALALAAIGVAGLLAYAVARRTNELGIRMAIGATTANVVGLVLRDSFVTVGIGLVMGLPLAFGISRILRSTLFQMDSFDPSIAALSLAALVSIAVLAAWMPARRAARIDPMTALREE